MAKRTNPIHPGEVLKEDFMAPLGVNAYRLAKDVGVTAMRIGEIVRVGVGSRPIPPFDWPHILAPTPKAG